MPGTEVRAYQHGIAILPRHTGLRLRQSEAVGDEFHCRQVELADHGRVRSAARELHQCQREVGFDHLRPGPHPLLVVSRGQRVEVDQDVPLRGFAAIALQRGAAPQSAWVVRVAPVVVEELTAPSYVGDAGVGVEDFQRLGAHALETFTAELGQRRFVVCVHPGERVVAGDVLEPEVGVVVHGTIVTAGVV